jgi:hypothetical protein
MAQTWLSPADTAATPVRNPSVMLSWPLSLLPQHARVPLVVSAQVKPPPHDTDAMPVVYSAGMLVCPDVF